MRSSTRTQPCASATAFSGARMSSAKRAFCCTKESTTQGVASAPLDCTSFV